MKKWSIEGVTILTPEEQFKKGTVAIDGATIERVSKGTVDSPLPLEIGEGVCVPGLINAHDHLLGTYHPKVGNGPYENWLPWDNDLKSSPVYQERQQIENRDLYLLGAYRNLFSGVTTVSDHIPHFVAEPYYDMLPMKAIEEYSLAHSIASFALAWGDEISVEYEKAVENDLPFITHIAEGFDSETVNDLETLYRKGGLGEHSVLVHGIAFSASDMDKIRDGGGSIVWCGDSNMFMFNQTLNAKMALDKGINVCIGTDSPMSGGENILYEMKYDKALFRELYDKELTDEKILKMVTTNPARAFRLHDRGQVSRGFTADLTVFRHNGVNAINSVTNADLSDVLLVVIDGRPVYGLAEYSEIFDELGVKYQNIIVEGTERVIIGDLLGLMKRISRAVGFKKEFSFIPVEFDF